MAFEQVKQARPYTGKKALRVFKLGFSAPKALAVRGERVDIEVDFERRIVRFKVSDNGLLPVSSSGVISCRRVSRRIKSVNPGAEYIEMKPNADGWHYGTF